MLLHGIWISLMLAYFYDNQCFNCQLLTAICDTSESRYWS